MWMQKHILKWSREAEVRYYSVFRRWDSSTCIKQSLSFSKEMLVLLRNPVLIGPVYIWGGWHLYFLMGFGLLLHFSHCHQTVQLWGHRSVSPAHPVQDTQGVVPQKAFFHIAFWWAVPLAVAGSLIFTQIPAVLGSSLFSFHQTS